MATIHVLSKSQRRLRFAHGLAYHWVGKERTKFVGNPDLSRNCAAPLTAYYTQKENENGNETISRIQAGIVRVALASGLARKQVAADFGIHCQAGYVYMPETGVFNIEPVGSTGS
ncbi:MAG: hypothetical protein L3J30_11980, partial [Marinosulfonomonas sp.]|nr:hypothetical protein [Marinosulfonomonas sp.]